MLANILSGSGIRFRDRDSGNGKLLVYYVKYFVLLFYLSLLSDFDKSFVVFQAINSKIM